MSPSPCLQADQAFPPPQDMTFRAHSLASPLGFTEVGKGLVWGRCGPFAHLRGQGSRWMESLRIMPTPHHLQSNGLGPTLHPVWLHLTCAWFGGAVLGVLSASHFLTAPPPRSPQPPALLRPEHTGHGRCVGLGEALCESRCEIFVYVSRVRAGSGDSCCWERGCQAEALCPRRLSPTIPASLLIWAWPKQRSHSFRLTCPLGGGPLHGSSEGEISAKAWPWNLKACLLGVTLAQSQTARAWVPHAEEPGWR